MPSIPATKATFTLGAHFSGMSACRLAGRTVYVLYSCNETKQLGGSSFLKKIDLDTFTGDEWTLPNQMSRETADNTFAMLSISEGALVIYGETPELLNLETFEVMYTERDGKLNREWDDYSWLQYWNGKAIRGASFGDLSRGAAVIDVSAAPAVSGHLDVDIGVDFPWYGPYVGGLRASGDVAVYSAQSQRYVFQAPKENFKFRDNPAVTGGVVFAGSRVFFVAGDTLLVGDLNSGEVLFSFNYLACEKIQLFLAQFNCKARDAYATSLAVAGEKVFLASSILRGYILCIDLEAVDVTWLQGFEHGVEALVTQGDLVYATAATVPTAWDIHTGEKVWEAMESIQAGSAQISEDWLIFSEASGYTRCFKLEAPYSSNSA